MTFSAADNAFMARALKLAARGMNTTTPNPRVGCVIVKNGDVVGEGFHLKAGGAHAEIEALQAAGGQSRDAEVYVTLEPCSHQGKTGPCVQALIDAGVSRVVYAMEDPNPLVSGQGIEQLKAAGLVVNGPLMEEDASKLNLGFVKRMRSGRPVVRCKMAMSIDGRTAMASGESKWVTGPHAREDVQKLRARSCAIVTGVDSVIADDPSLTVRLGEHDRQPLRVILDTHGRCPEKADILHQVGRTVVVSADSAPKAVGRENWSLPTKAGRIDLNALLSRLAEEGCNEVLLETGATLAGAFLAQGLIDELIFYVAPKLMGSSARPLFDLPIDKMSGHLPIIIRDIRAVGDDWRVTAVPDPEG